MDLFRRRSLTVLLSVAAVSFLAFIVLNVFRAETSPVRSTGNDSYSISALGHRAWVALLDELEVPVVVRRERRSKPSEDSLVVFAEPTLDEGTSTGVNRLRQMVSRVLVVLPKWRGVDDPTGLGRVGWVTPVDEDRVDGVLAHFGLEADLVRHPGRTLRTEWTGDGLEGVPDMPYPQLLSGDVDPILECPEGVLIGSLPEDPGVIFLSDPDLIANHGLRRGDNARLAVELVERARGNGVVLVDEAVHGHGVERSMWRDLFTFPLVLLLVQGVLALGAALWAGMQRFGSPRAIGAAHVPGRTTLVDNTAGLLLYGGRSRQLLARYLERTVDAVAQGHSGLREASRDERRAAAIAAESRRETTDRIEELISLANDCVREGGGRRSTAADRRAIAIARRIHTWRGEILDGHRTGRRDRAAHS